MRRGPAENGTEGGTARRRPPYGWLLPSVLLLGAMTVWGAVRYPKLPDRVPQHIGASGVDAWTDRTVWTVFVPVLLYAGVTLVLVGCTVLVVRVTPLDELTEPRDRWAAAASSMSNRPASAASARRAAKALFVMNACMGVGFLPLSWLQWRGSTTAAVPAWVLPVTLTLFLLAVVPVLVAAWRDAAERKRAG